MRHPDGKRLHFYELVGAAIRSAREAEGHTQASLARELRMSQSALAHIEQGTQPCPLYTLALVAEVFDLSLDELVPVHVATEDAS